jgi:hypothetical protein
MYIRVCDPEIDVKPMKKKSPKRQYRRYLLLILLGISLVMQVSAVSDLRLDLSSPYHDVFTNTTVILYAHVYDPGYPSVKFSNTNIGIWVNSNAGVTDNLGGTTNSSGWAAISYTPPAPGKYFFNGVTRVNYSATPGLPKEGMKEAITHDSPHINATSRYFSVTPLMTFVLATTTTAPATTTTPVPAVTTPTPALQTTPVTLVTQVTPVTQATPVSPATPAPQLTPGIPGSQSDTIPPVTTLTFAGTQDSSGRYPSGITCTLTAADNAGGSGVSVTQYSFDGTRWNTYNQPFPLVTTGPMILYYRSSDNAGNAEVANVKAFAISGTGAAPAGTATTLQYGTPSVATASSDIAPFHPMPLWLIALIIFVFIAAIGGGLYLKSRLDAEQKK